MSGKVACPLFWVGGRDATMIDLTRKFSELGALCILARGNPVIVCNRQGFVCRFLPANKKANSLRPLRLCGESLSALIGENLRLIVLCIYLIFILL